MDRTVRRWPSGRGRGPRTGQHRYAPPARRQDLAAGARHPGNRGAQARPGAVGLARHPLWRACFALTTKEPRLYNGIAFSYRLVWSISFVAWGGLVYIHSLTWWFRETNI